MHSARRGSSLGKQRQRTRQATHSHQPWRDGARILPRGETTLERWCAAKSGCNGRDHATSWDDTGGASTNNLGESEEQCEGAVDRNDCLVIDTTDGLTDLVRRDGLGFVDHYLRWLQQSIPGGRCDCDTKQRSVA